MKIGDIITKYYNDLHKYVNPNVVVSLSNTEEDLLQDVCVKALNKYKDEDITENEGLEYLKKTLNYAKLFQYNKKKQDILTFTDDISIYDKTDTQ